MRALTACWTRVPRHWVTASLAAETPSLSSPLRLLLPLLRSRCGTHAPPHQRFHASSSLSSSPVLVGPALSTASASPQHPFSPTIPPTSLVAPPPAQPHAHVVVQPHRLAFPAAGDAASVLARRAVDTVLFDALHLRPDRDKLYVLFDRNCPLAAHLADAYGALFRSPRSARGFSGVWRDIDDEIARYQCLLPQQASPRSSSSSAASSASASSSFSSLPTPAPPDFALQCIQQDMFSTLRPGDAVVLVQTGAFRLDAYRFRLRLFERGIRSVEHAHLGLLAHAQVAPYLHACAVPPALLHRVGRALKAKLDTARRLTIVTAPPAPAGVTSAPAGVTPAPAGVTPAQLEVRSPLEPTLLNTGCAPSPSPATPFLGGTFPVGEVFTEARDLSAVDGRVWVSGYPRPDRTVADRSAAPFWLDIAAGHVAATDPAAPADFCALLDAVRAAEGGVVAVREIGVGLNPAMGPASTLAPPYPPAMIRSNRSRHVNSLVAFERQLGLHLSLGRRHTVFPKTGAGVGVGVGAGAGTDGKEQQHLSRKRSQAVFHIDVFLALRRLERDDGEVLMEVADRDGDHPRDDADPEAAWTRCFRFAW